MAKRRGRGEGGISPTPHGRYRAFFVIETDGDKRKRITKNFRLKADATEWLRRQRADHAAGHFTSGGSMTVAAWLGKWIAMRRETVDLRTVRSYEERGQRHLLPYLGSKPLISLKPETVMDYYSRLNSAGVPANMRAFMGMMLRAVLADAVKAGLLASNPALKVPKPRKPRPEMDAWTAGESRAFLAVLLTVPQPYRTLFRFLLDTGCRPSEAFALTWDDYKGGSVSITKGLVDDGKRSEIRVKETKTTKGRRSVMLAASTRAELDSLEILERNGDLIFPCPKHGSWLRIDLIMRRFYRTVKRAGLKRIRLYDLRHTSATLLLQAGVNVKVIADRLGHEDPAITLRVYAHALPSMQATAADAAEKLWGPSPVSHSETSNQSLHLARKSM